MPRVGKPGRLRDAAGRVIPQVYVYATSIRAVAKVGKRQEERRYPLETDPSVIIRWQLNTKADLLSVAPKKVTKSSLRADAPTYLATITGRRQKDDRALLQHWIESAIADLPHPVVTRAMVKAQLAAWEEAGVAASTINHRLRALRNFYREILGEEEDNPTDKIKKRQEPRAQPRGVPYDLIEAIIAYMPDRGRPRKGGKQTGVSLGKARARVMAWTGVDASVLGRVRRVHFNRAAATLVLQPRRKGKGAHGETVPLLPEAVDALVAFFDAGAEGRFNTSAFYQQWQRAQRALERALREQVERDGGDPSSITVPHMRPKDLRHSFGTEVYRLTSDLLAVRKLLQHAKVTTSERYVEGAVDHSAGRAIEVWKQSRGAGA